MGATVSRGYIYAVVMNKHANGGSVRALEKDIVMLESPFTVRINDLLSPRSHTCDGSEPSKPTPDTMLRCGRDQYASSVAKCHVDFPIRPKSIHRDSHCRLAGLDLLFRL